MASVIIVRGGGDLASGVVLRLLRSGLRVIVTELPQPLAVRRTVAFAEAIYAGQVTIEGFVGKLVKDPTDTFQIITILSRQQVPVLIDPACTAAKGMHAAVVVDARMTKQPPEPIGYVPTLYLGLGPAFVAGQNCQVAVETRRSHTLGRVYWQGSPESDTGQPEGNPKRVLRAPAAGELVPHAEIGQHLETGQVIAEVAGQAITAPFPGVLRGLLHAGVPIPKGLKVGDIDQRDDPRLCQFVSDKSLAIGGGVLEAILSKPELRRALWD